MRPHELISELVRRTGKSTLAVATEMRSKGFHGTLYKFMAGDVASPSRRTAERIARYFGLDVDVIYDAKKAAAEATRRGIEVAPVGTTILTLREPTPEYQIAASPHFSPRLYARLANLTRSQSKALEQAIHAHLDAIGIDAHGKQPGTNDQPHSSSG